MFFGFLKSFPVIYSDLISSLCQTISRCVALNNFVPKSKRVFKPQLTVVPQQNVAAVQRLAGRLMGPFQDAQIRLKERSPLYLLCAAYHPVANSDATATAAEVRWTFTPRASVIPIALEGFANELKFSQVIRDQHDGVYNCSTRNDHQVSGAMRWTVIVTVDIDQFSNSN